MARMKFLCDAERCIECNGCFETSKGALGKGWDPSLPTRSPCKSPKSE